MLIVISNFASSCIARPGQLSNELPPTLCRTRCRTTEQRNRVWLGPQITALLQARPRVSSPTAKGATRRIRPALFTSLSWAQVFAASQPQSSFASRPSALQSSRELRNFAQYDSKLLPYCACASPHDLQIGAGIQLPPNATRVLHRLGVLDQVTPQSVRPRDILLRSYRDGSVLRSLPVPAQSKDSFPLLVTHRADLCQILYSAAVSSGAEVRFGVSVQKIDETGPAVELTTGETIAADVILGTDGARSVCREALLQRPDPPQYSGTLIYRVVIPFSAVLKDDLVAELVKTDRVHLWLGPGAHVVCYGLKGLLSVVISQPEDGESEGFDMTKGDLEKLRRNLKDWDPVIGRLLQLADMTLRWPLLATKQMKEWVGEKGRFALVGDAAHATYPLLFVFSVYKLRRWL